MRFCVPGKGGFTQIFYCGQAALLLWQPSLMKDFLIELKKENSCSSLVLVLLDRRRVPGSNEQSCCKEAATYSF